MQLAFDITIADPGRLFPDPPDEPTGLSCSYCGYGDKPRFGKYPQPGGKMWKPGVNFHPYCLDDLRRYGCD